MWLILALAGLIIMFMLWLHGDLESQISIQSNPRASTMSETAPPILSRHPAITYRLTRWDLLVNHLTLCMRNRILQLFLVLFLGWQLWSGLSRGPGFPSIPGLAAQVLLILVFYGILVVSTMVLIGFAMAFLLKQRGVVCEHLLEITDEGLVESTEMNRTLHNWSSVTRIMNIFGYLFVYVGDQVCHQIPRRRIPPEEMAVFEAELRARAA